VLRQSNTTFVNLRAALDDLEPLVNTAKPATKDLAPFLRELRPVFQKLLPFTRNLRLVVSRPGKANDARELLAVMPQVQDLTSRTFPHSEQAVEDFQPNLNFIRAYTPDFFNAIGKLGQVAGYYDGNGHYVRAATAGQNLFRYAGGTLEPISKAEQFAPFEELGSFAVRQRCPGGATQPAADGSSPWVGGGSVDPSTCDPSDVPPGP
jgi:phospholipid/cholesterol/gamma-HCH transport system substrate-binding protein